MAKLYRGEIFKRLSRNGRIKIMKARKKQFDYDDLFSKIKKEYNLSQNQLSRYTDNHEKSVIITLPKNVIINYVHSIVELAQRAVQPEVGAAQPGRAAKRIVARHSKQIKDIINENKAKYESRIATAKLPKDLKNTQYIYKTKLILQKLIQHTVVA